MKLAHAAALFFASIITGAAGNQGSSSTPPLDEEGFAKAAAARIRQEVPAYDIKPTTRLTLEGTRSDGESTGQLNLDRIYAFCLRNPGNCSAALDEYARGMGQTIKERDQPIEQSMVRIVVRPAEYFDRIRQQAGSGPKPISIYGRPLGAGLVLVPVLDYSRAVRFLGEQDLAKLKLTEGEAFGLGERNLRASLKPLADVAPVPGPNEFGTIMGEDYASSRIALHDDWKALADQLGGNLIVMLPAPDILLYGNGSTREGVEALRAYGNEMAQRSPRPLSLTVLRWTSGGWDALK
ncbi:hypothetical protein [Chitinimonas koreensis]|uniref:hypothetical protein n=1 Tax=Chitinimonas koreensis TaxID=356302 RepID=UPI000684C2D0|nr:hypothetical protein [Chitinimonas koreensis]QNM97601.1 hypothetical protein H9L41_04685 [Chitinimonas koreensis]